MQEVLMISLNKLVPMSYQIRETIDEETLTELTETVKTHGVLEPLLVRHRPSEEGKFEIICGLCRFEAAKRAGLKAVPCIVRDLTDQEACEITFIENEQRSDLSDYERGKWLKTMMENFPDKYPSQKTLAARIGKSHDYVSKMILHYEKIEEYRKSLPNNISTRVEMLPERVTREVRRAPPELQSKVLETVVKEDMSVRETRNLVDALAVPPTTSVEAVRVLQAEAKRKVEEEKAKQEAFHLKLTRYYPSSLVDEALERAGEASEEKTLKFLLILLDVAWQLLTEHGLVDRAFEEASRRL